MKIPIKTCIELILILSVMRFSLLCAQSTKSNEEIFSKAKIGFEKINKNLKISPMTIDLDSKNPNILKRTLIIDAQNDKPKAKYYVANISSILALKDTLLILDEKQNAMLISDLKGNIIKDVGRIGSGPGEFKKPAMLLNNKKYLFIYDHSNARIQVFDRKYKYVKSFPYQYTCYRKNIGISDDVMITNYGFGTPYKPKTYDISKLSFKEIKILPDQFNYDIDLGSYNINYEQLFKISQKYIVSAGSVLPYLYIYDGKGKPLYSIELKGKVVEKKINIKQNTIFILVDDLELDGTNLYLLILNKLYRIDLQSKQLMDVYILNDDKDYSDKFTLYNKAIFFGNSSKVWSGNI